ncbi:MAG: right-handed parallel beta-helix repeat-containing protein [Kineosporiaceae bacterium]|nr:right-handed parallel beta-helix repeat-containing protein [Kineosporiaceae bacterium]
MTSKGAKPGDSGDDTATIQAALDAVPSGGTVVVPDGVYMINATRGVRPKSSTTLRLSSGSVLRAIATSSGNYNLIRIQDVSNVAVVGGTVEGDLGRHQGTDGQWGHGISIVDARSVTIDSVAAVQAWGDGFYVGGTTSANITLCRVRADHNRRQGISVTDVDGMVIRNSAFTRTLGEPGGAGSGIDLEPNGNQHVHNVQLLNNTITDNSVQGLSIGMNNAFVSTSTNKNITVRGNTFDNNGLSASASIMRTGCPDLGRDRA